MRQILAAEYDQLLLLAPAVEDWLPGDHPARFIREFVAALDLKDLELDTLTREEGGVAYDPRLLLSAWLYGYSRKVRSTRGLEQACREDLGFIWLTGNHRPDHHALWRFWSNHREGVRKLFSQSVKVALKMNLVGIVVQAVDGTKVMASCDGRGGYHHKHLAELLAQLDVQVSEREQQIAQAGEQASSTLPVELSKKQQLREQVRCALAQVEAGECKHAHPKEPGAARMECEGRNRFAYNAQAVVDAKAQIVVAADVTTQANDSAQLVRMVAQAQANCEPTAATPLTLADGGYANAEQASAAERAGFPVVTPPPNAWRDTSDPFHASHFQHDGVRKLVVCPQNRELPLQRIREKDGKQVEVYRSAKICKDCPVRALCTKDRHGRTIDIQPGHAAVVELLRRWQEPATAELYELRAATIEPVFAQIKQNMGFRRFTVRGLQKVSAQWAMLCTTWNLKVMFRRWRGHGGPNDGGSTVPAPGSVRPSGLVAALFHPADALIPT